MIRALLKSFNSSCGNRVGHTQHAASLIRSNNAGRKYPELFEVFWVISVGIRGKWSPKRVVVYGHRLQNFFSLPEPNVNTEFLNPLVFPVSYDWAWGCSVSVLGDGDEEETELNVENFTFPWIFMGKQTILSQIKNIVSQTKIKFGGLVIANCLYFRHLKTCCKINLYSELKSHIIKKMVLTETSTEREIYQSRSFPTEGFVLKDCIFLQNKKQFRNSQDVTDVFFPFQSWR